MNPFQELKFRQYSVVVNASQCVVCVGKRQDCSCFHRVSGLLDAAMMIIRGIFPNQSPYYFYDTGSYLPWRAALEEIEGTGLLSEFVARVVKRIEATVSLGALKDGPLEWFGCSCYLKLEPHEEIQTLAALILLALDRHVHCRRTGVHAEALEWLSAAYESLMEVMMTVFNRWAETQESGAAYWPLAAIGREGELVH
jgi:hypothetical protein